MQILHTKLFYEKPIKIRRELFTANFGILNENIKKQNLKALRNLPNLILMKCGPSLKS